MLEALLSKSNREHRHSRGALQRSPSVRNVLRHVARALPMKGGCWCLLFWTADVLEKMFSPRSFLALCYGTGAAICC